MVTKKNVPSSLQAGSPKTCHLPKEKEKKYINWDIQYITHLN